MAQPNVNPIGGSGGTQVWHDPSFDVKTTSYELIVVWFLGMSDKMGIGLVTKQMRDVAKEQAIESKIQSIELNMQNLMDLIQRNATKEGLGPGKDGASDFFTKGAGKGLLEEFRQQYEKLYVEDPSLPENGKVDPVTGRKLHYSARDYYAKVLQDVNRDPAHPEKKFDPNDVPAYTAIEKLKGQLGIDGISKQYNEDPDGGAKKTNFSLLDLLTKATKLNPQTGKYEIQAGTDFDNLCKIFNHAAINAYKYNHATSSTTDKGSNEISNASSQINQGSTQIQSLVTVNSAKIQMLNQEQSSFSSTGHAILDNASQGKHTSTGNQKTS